MLKNLGKITPKDVMDVLRNHNITPEEEANWSPAKAKADSPCHHATGIIIPDQSTGSLVSHILKDLQVHWVTGSSAPCISTFKPIFLPKPGLKKRLILSAALYDPDSFWWLNEKFQRLVSKDYQQRLNLFKDERDKLEMDFLKKTDDIIKTVSGKPDSEDLKKITKVSNDAFDKSIKKITEWTEKIEKLPIKAKPSFRYRVFWNRQNKQVMLEM